MGHISYQVGCINNQIGCISNQTSQNMIISFITQHMLWVLFKKEIHTHSVLLLNISLAGVKVDKSQEQSMIDLSTDD